MAAAEPFTEGNYGPHAAELINLRRAGAMGGVESGMVPAQRAAGANMSVDISSGYFYITQTRYTYAGGNQAVSAADPTNPRWDIIYFKSDGIHYLAGTAAASPTMPVLPASSILTAAVYVAAGATQILDASIYDERVIVPGQNIITADRVLAASVVDAKLASTFFKRLAADNTTVSKVYADGSATEKTLSSVPYSNAWMIVAQITTGGGGDSVASLKANGTTLATVINETQTIVAYGAQKSATATDWVFTVIKSGASPAQVAVTMAGSAVTDVLISWSRGGSGGNTFLTRVLEVWGDY